MRDATIAFAGMLQASELVRQVATSGNCSQQAAAASITSIFNTSPESTEAVYGGLGGVRMGMRVMVEMFSARNSQENLLSLNYALGLAKLGRQIQRDRQRQADLGREIELIKPAWKNSEEVLDDSVLAQLAEAYHRHISSMDFRLSVSGKPEYLKQDEKVAFIRSLLLAGIRSAFLWRQVGGRQWRLIFQRRKMLQQAQNLLAA